MRTKKLFLDTDRLEVMDIDGDAEDFSAMDIEVVPACIRINVPEGHAE
jgi:diacylglycerol kinase (ATP)